MICQNSDKFGISQIRIEKNIIQDSEGNSIFKTNCYSSAEQFSCDISLNSLEASIPDNETKLNQEQPEPEDEQDKEAKNNYGRYWMKNGSGLSGSIVAAIIIPLVLVVIIIIIVYCPMNKGISSRKNDHSNDSTINKLSMKSS